MTKVRTIGIDPAKRRFQLHGVRANGSAAFRKQASRFRAIWRDSGSRVPRGRLAWEAEAPGAVRGAAAHDRYGRRGDSGDREGDAGATSPPGRARSCATRRWRRDRRFMRMSARKPGMGGAGGADKPEERARTHGPRGGVGKTGFVIAPSSARERFGPDPRPSGQARGARHAATGGRAPGGARPRRSNRTEEIACANGASAHDGK